MEIASCVSDLAGMQQNVEKLRELLVQGNEALQVWLLVSQLEGFKCPNLSVGREMAHGGGWLVVSLIIVSMH